MTIQNTRIAVSSSKATHSNIYFKLEAGDVFISPVTQHDKIVEILNLQGADQSQINFEIWSYQPHRLVTSWVIAWEDLSRKRHYEIKEGQWTITFQTMVPDEISQNKENRKSTENKKISSCKTLKNGDLAKNRNCSHCKDLNLASLKKNKDKAAVKKALKHTIECLIKQQQEIKKVQDHSIDRILYAKTAKCSPSVKLIPGLKNQSVLFSDYGFDSAEFNRQYAAKQLPSVENQQNQPSERPLKKRKSKLN